MPTYKGFEVWIEDSTRRKLDYQELTINLFDSDDRTVTVKTEMFRDEPYSVHCLSPISVFCDVFVIAASHVRKSAARFYIDKSLVASENASGSSKDHVLEQFRDRGLRTPKRQFQHGKLGVVEVEIRRIDKIIKGNFGEEYGTDADEGITMDFIMIDDPEQPPWLVFRFDICVKESLAVPAPTAELMRRRAPRRTLTNQSLAIGGSQARPSIIGSSNGTSNDTNYGCLHGSKKRSREHDDRDGSSGTGRMPTDGNLSSDQLQQEYEKEEAEEQRLLRKLQERLQTKKTRNMELRRLLGETE